jgi:transposase-like protein
VFSARVLDEWAPAAWHVVEQHANNPIEVDHGRLKSRLRPMRGLKRLQSARVTSVGLRSCRISVEATTKLPLTSIRTHRRKPLRNGCESSYR